jgi:hypothetical protein
LYCQLRSFSLHFHVQIYMYIIQICVKVREKNLQTNKWLNLHKYLLMFIKSSYVKSSFKVQSDAFNNLKNLIWYHFGRTNLKIILKNFAIIKTKIEKDNIWNKRYYSNSILNWFNKDINLLKKNNNILLSDELLSTNPSKNSKI